MLNQGAKTDASSYVYRFTLKRHDKWGATPFNRFFLRQKVGGGGKYSFQKRYIQLRLISVVLILIFTPKIIYASAPEEPHSSEAFKLFSIKKSDNRNEVVYEVKLDKDGNFVKSSLRAHWILWEDGGKTQPLNLPEKEFAFGIQIDRHNDKELEISLVSANDCEFTVKSIKSDERWKAQAYFTLKSETVIVEEIFVNVRGSGLFGSVGKVEMKGRDVSTGKPKVLNFHPEKQRDHPHAPQIQEGKSPSRPSP